MLNILFWSKVLVPDYPKGNIWAQSKVEMGVKNGKYAILAKIFKLES